MSTKEKLKTIALSHFANHGYDGTSLEKIAQEVGIRKSSIYSHFSTKEELFFCVFEDVLNSDAQTIHEITKNFKDSNTKEKLYAVYQYYSRYFDMGCPLDNTIFLKRAMLFPPAFMKERLQSRFEEYEKSLNTILTAILEEGFKNYMLKAMDINDLLATFYCLIDGLFVESHYYPRKEYTSRINAIWQVFWTGISNQ